MYTGAAPLRVTLLCSALVGSNLQACRAYDRETYQRLLDASWSDQYLVRVGTAKSLPDVTDTAVDAVRIAHNEILGDTGDGGTTDIQEIPKDESDDAIVVLNVEHTDAQDVLPSDAQASDAQDSGTLSDSGISDRADVADVSDG